MPLVGLRLHPLVPPILREGRHHERACGRRECTGTSFRKVSPRGGGSGGSLGISSRLDTPPSKQGNTTRRDNLRAECSIPFRKCVVMTESDTRRSHQEVRGREHAPTDNTRCTSPLIGSGEVQSAMGWHTWNTKCYFKVCSD